MPPSRHRFANWDDISKATHGRPKLSNIPNTIKQYIVHVFASLFYISMYLLHNLWRPLLVWTAPVLVMLVKYALSPLFIVILALSMPLVGVAIFVTATLEPGVSLPAAICAALESMGECWTQCILRSYPGLDGRPSAPINPVPLATAHMSPPPAVNADWDPLEKNPARSEEVGEGRTNKFWRAWHISEYPASELGGGGKVKRKGNVPELKRKSRLAVEWTPPGKSNI
jgi:hypothetical protein